MQINGLKRFTCFGRSVLLPTIERQAANRLPIEGEAVHHAVNPERQRRHSLLYPTLKAAKDDLRAGLAHYEIKEVDLSTSATFIKCKKEAEDV